MTAAQLQKYVEAIDRAARRRRYKRLVLLIDKFFERNKL